MTDHADWNGVRDFVLLFIPVWWVWIGMTVYSERFETYDLSFRIFTLLHLLAVSGMAASAEYGLRRRPQHSRCLRWPRGSSSR